MMKWIELGIGAIVVCTLTLKAESPASSALSEALAASYQHEAAAQYPEAIADLSGLTSNKRDYLVNLRLGWLNYLNGAHADSLQCYKNAVLAAPKSLEPRLGGLLPLLALGRYADAEIAAREALRLDPSNYYGNLRLAYALRMQLKFAPAEQIDRQMLLLYPTDTRFLLEMGLCQWGQKQTAEAQKTFKQVLLVDPQNADAKQSLQTLTGN